MTTTIAPPRMTFQEFRNMELADNDNFIYELLNGNLVKRASPSFNHQDVHAELFARMRIFASEKRLGKVVSAPMDVFFDDGNCPQPDIVFISSERSFIIEKGYINGAPDLIVEIISPGTGKNDRGIKKDLYERYAVKEYWVIDPMNQTVEVFNMKENAYRLTCIQEAEGVVVSEVLAGFEIEVSTLFGLEKS
ncbi:MAG: Uma2 family endonuclease [Saprospiraceae bacterium]